MGLNLITGGLSIYFAAPSDALEGAGAITIKPSGDADDFFTLATVSNIPTIYGTGSYVRIGDAAATNHSLALEDDLMVSGKLEVDGYAFFDEQVHLADFKALALGNGFDSKIIFNSQDPNAKSLFIMVPDGGANNVPVLTMLTFTCFNGVVNYGLFDGLTQPLYTPLEKGGQLHSTTAGFADAGAATAILKRTNGFTNAVVGDIVRITAGTLCTVGWYWITTVTSASQVTLDRDYTSGDTTNVTFVTFHNFPMLGADGVCLKCFDGAPGDANVEIDRDGWLQLDVSQANGRLYWRANNAWHYVDATAGLSLPAEERIDPSGHKFEIGDEVKLIVDRINDDGSFHAIPHFRG